MATSRMRTTTPQIDLPTQRQQGCGAVAPTQRAFEFDSEIRRNELTTGLYDVFRKAMAARGGADALRAALDERESFRSDISKALNRMSDGAGQRRVPLDWVAGVVLDSDGAYEFAAGVNALLGFEPPVRKREVESADVERAAREVIAEMDEEHREIYRRKIARKCGVKPEAIKF